jgi:hypothetical protein
LLMMSSCPGTFAVAKNPNNALIWPVQFCRATSAIGLRLSTIAELTNSDVLLATLAMTP